ncbi:GNAT family N-acetyltransferase [Fusobacterium sp.]|uniref:GNAT family N-acetyltransferase n=1 Tax=Fusobacterium sp. TaxID=68766 RepID=UPI002902AD38|nr:GNAT family N-acetyltransferase [Fusobacterium sp.]MDU1909994.1 GNAT family N-acetyltransferase [Fusobacterium sp.]
MKIEKINILTEEQKNKIINLQKICNKFENLKAEVFLSNEINFDKEIPCFFLCYEKEELIAFLTAFLPTKEEGEISAFTHPKYRKKGIFKKLFEESVEILRKNDIPKILFVTEPESKSSKEVLKRIGKIKLVRSEYTMSYLKESFQEENDNKRLKFETVTEKNKRIYSQMTEEIFEMPEGTSINFVENVIKSVDRDAYIGYLNKENIGIFNMNYIKDGVFLYGLGIRNFFKRKGYGKEIMNFALKKAFEKGSKALLDVDSDNVSAYSLYKKLGFVIEFQADYYEYYIK